MIATEDAEQLASRIAVLRVEHDQRSEIEARRRSRDFFRRTGEKIPSGLSVDGDVDILIDAHREYWLRSAEHFAKAIDPLGLGAGDVHALPTSVLGLPDHGSGYFIPGLFGTVREHLRTTARPGPVVWLNIRGHARHATADAIETASEIELREVVRASLAATMSHEIAHAVDAEVAGRSAPPGVSIDVLRLVAAAPKDPGQQQARHGSAWARAFAILTERASRFRHGDFFRRVFDHDIRASLGVAGDDLSDSLGAELGLDEPVADILRRRPPASFLRLVEASLSSRRPSR